MAVKDMILAASRWMVCAQVQSTQNLVDSPNLLSVILAHPSPAAEPTRRSK